MQGMDYTSAQGSANWIYLVPALVLVLALRAWLGGARQRNIRIERLWILPTIFAVLVAGALVRQPPPPTVVSVLSLAAALAVGFGLGWLRGRLTTITVEPETHTLKGQNSALSFVLIAGLFVLRAGARQWVSEHAAQWHVSPLTIFDAFLLLALGVIVGRRVEILLRSLRLLAAARAARAAGQAVPAEITEAAEGLEPSRSAASSFSTRRP
jgi:membrane protein CcdC involved in cytochrome C biogenesis